MHRRKLIWMEISLILATGLIHLIDVPGSFGEAPYKGLLFVANGVGAVVAALGIYRGSRIWGWGLGCLVAGGALMGYIISHTVGLPGLAPDNWLEPLGVASLVVEVGFVALALAMLPRLATIETPMSMRRAIENEAAGRI